MWTFKAIFSQDADIPWFVQYDWLNLTYIFVAKNVDFQSNSSKRLWCGPVFLRVCQDFLSFYRLYSFLSPETWTFRAILFWVSIYRNPLNVIIQNPSVFLSLKMWTFGAILVNAGRAGLCLPGFSWSSLLFIVYTCFCRQKRGLLEQFIIWMPVRQ